ncbi:Aspartate--tRNA ligase, mitochondrial, partial [Stegodyphus mimosarum]
MFAQRFYSSVKNVSYGGLRYLCSRLNSFTWRTHTCGELNTAHVGQEVIICGWISYQRLDKFIILRDQYGLTQVIFKENDNSNKKFLQSLSLESVVQVKGIVQKRPLKDVRKELRTGEIEVEVTDINLLNASIPMLPISAKNQEKVNDVTKLKYRYLYLRNPKIQENLRMRSKMLMKMREFLHEKYGFVDVETPTLFKKTPGGAKEFIVPTKFPGNVYALTQSPQQFKQMLMVGGLDRYFQIARCYRNEGTKVDRQPEFTQLDVEASFVTSKDIQALIEQLLKFSWPAEKSNIKIPFPCMTYADALSSYGTDKPDLRYEMKLCNVTSHLKNSGLQLASQANDDPDYIISSIVVPGGSKFYKNSMIKEYQQEAELSTVKLIPITIKDDMSWTSMISKHLATDTQQNLSHELVSKPGDLIFLAAGKSQSVYTFLGKIRVRCAELIHPLSTDLRKTNVFKFVWITEFPLFLQNEKGSLESAHHPFTAPYPNDIDLIYFDPCKARAQHYDLVLNGQEIGGGSIRIHDAYLQKYILEEILKEDSGAFQHLLDALSSGCPPHGGIALGIDRLLGIMCGCNSIADIIAFPKSLDGKDLLSGAPSPISHEDKLLYHIEPVMPKQ